MQVHFLVNTFRPDAVQAAKDAAKLLQKRGVEAFADIDSAKEVGLEAVSMDSFGDASLVLAIGGDGTLIRAAHLIGSLQTPIMGVHYGRFGFVTQVLPEQFEQTLNRFLDDECEVERRMMIQTELVRDKEVVATLHSLNESVVQRSATSRMLTFDVHVDGDVVSRYPADGVMVSTPTGSTAYNLSAGGPVVDPRLEAMVMTAILPHTLSARSLILRAESEVEIKVESREDAVLSCDGHSRLHLLSGDFVRVTKSERYVNLICVSKHDFFEKLADRLQWSQGGV